MATLPYIDRNAKNYPHLNFEMRPQSSTLNSISAKTEGWAGRCGAILYDGGNKV